MEDSQWAVWEAYVAALQSPLPDRATVESWLTAIVGAFPQSSPDKTVELISASLHYRRQTQPDWLPTVDGVVEIVVVHHYLSATPQSADRFEQMYVTAIRQRLMAMKLPAHQQDEVIQQTRVKLFTADDTLSPKIMRYAGDGKLTGLVVVTASRLALDMLRQPVPVEHDDALMLATTVDPQLGFLKDHYRAAFATAVRETMAELAPRGRNLLRLHHLDGVGLEPLATMYQVHRATVVRWLADARNDIFIGARKRLGISLGNASASEVDSVIALLASRFEVSMRSILS